MKKKSYGKLKPKGEVVSLQGYLTKIRFRKPGWAVGELVDGKITHVVTGDLPNPDENTKIDIIGEWIDTASYGRQLKVLAYSKPVPISMEGIANYLAQEVPGIGPKRAALLVEHFGDSLKDVLDNYPQRLAEVGFTSKTINRITNGWHSEHIQRQIGMFLAQYEISKYWVPRVMEVFGGQAVEVIKANPYKLVLIDGIGFKRADVMAKKMKWPENSPERLEAVFTHLLEQAAGSGHTHLPEDLLIAQALREVHVLPEVAAQALQRVIDRRELVRDIVPTPAGDVQLVYLPHLQCAEIELAEAIKIQTKNPNRQIGISPLDGPTAGPLDIGSVEKQMKLRLSDEQTEAVINAVASPISIITGGPGTGKTTTLKALVLECKRLGFSLALAAPTGRAAKRMAEVSGQDAKTIHRLLEFQPDKGKFDRDENNPLDADVVAIDEASMLDLPLARSLMNAIGSYTSIVFIGDADQLPSVGPGNVLKDMIACGKIKTTKLNQIFRQAENSLIVKNAYRIVKGETPSFPPPQANLQGDSHLIEVKGNDNVIEMVKKVVIKDIPEAFGIDPKDIQVLVPMKVGPVGTRVLNGVLQRALNPKGAQVGSFEFKVGDKIMQLNNDYNLDLFNGDIGIIESNDTEEKTFCVDFYDRKVDYPYESGHQVALAYASTIHKSQGSEYKACVIVMIKGHFIMLSRNLLYTANTRAKKLAMYVGDRAAINMATHNAEHGQRNSLLAWRLQH